MKIRSLLLTALCAAASLVSTVSAAPSDVCYAPQSADLILRINLPRILLNPVTKDFRSRPEVQKLENMARTEFAKAGMDLDDLLQSEIYFFYDTANLNSPKPDMIVRTTVPMAQKLFAGIDAASAKLDDKDEDKLYPEVVDGKQARLDRNVKPNGIIALDDDLFQVALEADKLSVLTKRNDPKLVGLVDPESLITVIYLVTPETAEKIRNGAPSAFQPVGSGLKTAALNICAEDDGIRLNLKLNYASAENAKASCEAIGAFVDSSRVNAEQNGKADTVAILKRINLSANADAVSVVFTCTGAEFTQYVNAIIGAVRQSRKNARQPAPTPAQQPAPDPAQQPVPQK